MLIVLSPGTYTPFKTTLQIEFPSHVLIITVSEFPNHTVLTD